MSILPNPKENFSQWYQELIQKAQLAENSDVRGSIIFKPYGYAIWENIRLILDKLIKNTGHQNAYFPLFIPKSFLAKEAEHVEGFAKECAVVTHHRLKIDENGELVVDPEAKLSEELIVRPTSETIIWNAYKRWIDSYRDLPILINQRANVVRWELRTRPFLRTSEFLWQEGHTAHQTEEEARQEAIKMREVYNDFFNKFLAISPLVGKKPEHEKFAGAVETYTLEVMAKDKKAIQAGTSHFLGQSFAKAFDVKYKTADNSYEYVRATSWGVSTRLLGALITSHGDEKGLVLPPAISPVHVIILPIAKDNEILKNIQDYLSPLIERLENMHLDFESQFGDKLKTNQKIKNGISIPLKFLVDLDNNKSFGWKMTERELKGVPLIIIVGEKEMKEGNLVVYRRNTREKETISLEKVVVEISKYLYKIQNDMFTQNQLFVKENMFEVDNYKDFKVLIEQGFVIANWDGTLETAEKIQEETKATIRIVYDKADGLDIYSGNKGKYKVLFAKAY